MRLEPWQWGALGAGALLLLVAKPFGGSEKDRDLDALADMLITETSFGRDPEEMAQIVWVAFNRSKRQNKPLWFVVQPGSAPRPVWNTGSVYRQRFESARRNPRWSEARAFAARVLAGGVSANRGKGMFVHPKNLDVPPCSNPNREPIQTPYGMRCLPKTSKGQASWSVIGTGNAMFA